MNERTIMKNFLHYMQKEHKFHMKWLLLWIFGIFTLMFNHDIPSEMSKNAATDLHLIVAGILLALGSLVFFRKYTELAPTIREKATPNDPRTVESVMHTNLSEIVRSHAFDVKTYFCLMIERFIIVQGVSIAVVLLTGAFKVIPLSDALFYSGMILIIPLAIWNWEMVLMDAARTHKRGSAYAVFMTLWYFIETVGTVLVLAYTFITCVLLISGLVQSNIMLSGIDNQAIAKCVTDDFVTPVLIILAFILVFFFADNNQMIISIKWTRKKRIYVACILLAIAGLIAFQGSSCKKERLVLRENSISVMHGVEKTYSFDEIKDYKVYYKDSDIKMEVTFTDGMTEDIFYSSSTYTDGWSERYSSDYQYMAELVDKLLIKSVKGSVEENVTKALNSKQTAADDKAYLEHVISVLEKNIKNS
ncbi:MAG: hypothetical protein IKS98_03520 [Lachnospiraceae bacterium]|nr:hypothetical protein [Lachnospiraceae bacterium]